MIQRFRRQVCLTLALDLVRLYHPHTVEVRIPDDERDLVQIVMDDGEVWPVERRWLESLLDAHRRQDLDRLLLFS